MFRCQICGQVAAAGTRATKVVVVSREKVYQSRGGGDSDGFRGRGRFRAPSKPKDKGGKGQEIVQELMACVSCAAKQVTQVVKAEPVEEPVVEEEVAADAEAAPEAEAETAATEEAAAEETPAEEAAE